MDRNPLQEQNGRIRQRGSGRWNQDRSPTAETDAINLILSWAASEMLRIQTLDITNAYFDGDDEGAVAETTKGRMLICRTPIYSDRFQGDKVGD